MSFRPPGRVRSAAVQLAVGGLVGFAMAAPPHLEGQQERVLEEGPSCDFIVYNRSGAALDVRMAQRGRFVQIGMVNPGEIVTASAPCAERRVWIAAEGIAQPWNPAPSFRAWADLVEGERTAVVLQYGSRHWQPNPHFPGRPRRG